MRKNSRNKKPKRSTSQNPDVIKVTSAIDLDAAIISKIKQIFGDKEVQLNKDSSITGGIIIESNDKLFDGSISHQLHKMAQYIKN